MRCNVLNMSIALGDAGSGPRNEKWRRVARGGGC